MQQQGEWHLLTSQPAAGTATTPGCPAGVIPLLHRRSHGKGSREKPGRLRGVQDPHVTVNGAG